MEFVVRTGDLLQELGLVQGIVERKTTIPILSNVRLEAKPDAGGGEIEIVATDLEVGIRTSCPAVVTKPGAMTLPARRLHDIVRLLPDSDLQLQAAEGGWASLQCERTRYRLAGAGVEDFPPLADYDFKNSVAIPLAPFKAMIQRVIFSITTEDPRYALNGALLVVGEGAVQLVATDGHRLAYIHRKQEGLGKQTMQVIVPRKTLSELDKFEPGEEGEVRFGMQGTQMFFRTGRRLLQSNTVEGSFPNWEKVMPAKNDRIMTVATSALRGALERVSLLSEDRSKLVRLTLDQGRLVLSSRNSEMGEAEETITADYEGPSFSVGFNARYVAEFLAAVDVERVRLELKDEQTQGLLRPDDGGEWDYRYVVMPMRLNN